MSVEISASFAYCDTCGHLQIVVSEGEKRVTSALIVAQLPTQTRQQLSNALGWTEFCMDTTQLRGNFSISVISVPQVVMTVVSRNML